MRRYSLAVALTFVVSLVVATGSAQAVVVDMNPASQGQATVTYPTDSSSYFGVAMVPGTRSNLAATGIPTVTTSGLSCFDPALTADMFLPPSGLCYHPGGSVLHKNETFALVWDPNPHRNWTAGYVEQFLRDVADGSASTSAHPNPSGNMSSPFALTPQYTDGGGAALYNSLYGGGYDDSRSYPSSGCTPSGTNPFYLSSNFIESAPNDVCLTDAQIKYELQTEIAATHLSGHLQPGYSPLLAVLTPPGVEVCLDSGMHLCSANSDPDHIPGSTATPAQFCSYHSQVVGLDGQVYHYVVQPETPTTGCDEPDAEPYPNPIPVDQLVTLNGQRLVSPLSQAMIAAIVNPGMNGWFALDGSEINDNGRLIDDNTYEHLDLGCIPVKGVDKATVGNNQYYLQREFNNGGAIVQDPYALPCSEGNTLQPDFVVPSPINNGDVVEFDGFRTPTTLLIPRANFQWSFGDGTTAVGASPVHAFTYGGTYTVTLTVTDRGGNTAVVTHPVTVLGPGKASPQPPPVKTTGPKLLARMQLMPQGLLSMLHSGVVIRVTSNMPANGVVTVSIPRADARRAHIKMHGGAAVVIGRGTVAGIKNGTVSLRLRLAAVTAKRLIHLRHLTVTIRIALVAKGAKPTAIVAAARF
jgi:hypothetical protein